ncbi:hypothetical protein LCGC14_3162130, partial [marine sediment metagenome]
MQGGYMPLPKLDTKDWEAEKGFYLRATREQITTRAKVLKMQPYSYDKRMRERGVYREKFEHEVETPALESEAVTIYTPYPNFDIKPFKLAKSDRDEEDLIVVSADKHLAKITESYNIEIAKERMDKLLDATMTIVNLHRPIRKLWVFVTGDMVQGENPHQGSKIGEVECGAYEQIHTYGIPILSRFLVSLLQGVADVEMMAVCGNHGKYDRIAPDKTNWDAFLYSGLETALINQNKVKINPPVTFYQLANIRGFRFFMIHGNQVNATQGIPLFAMRRKMQEWYA